jgi:hypothetical protein
VCISLVTNVQNVRHGLVTLSVTRLLTPDSFTDAGLFWAVRRSMPDILLSVNRAGELLVSSSVVGRVQLALSLHVLPGVHTFHDRQRDRQPSLQFAVVVVIEHPLRPPEVERCP